MSTVIDCPSCRRKLRVPREFLGKSVRCPTCDETFDAAEAAPGAPPAEPSQAPAPAAGPSPLITVPLKLELDEPPASRPAAEEPPKEAPSRRREPEPKGDDDRDERRRRRSFRRDFEPCPRCGDDIRRGSVVCPYCGLDLEEQGDGYSRRPRVRRDAEPHRGGTIQALGIASLVVGVFHFFFVISLPLGIAAWVMARRDLKKMDEGVMDPNGRKKTRDGRLCGIVGTVVSSIFALIGLLILFVVVLAESQPTPPRPNPPGAWPNNPPAWQNNPPGRPKPPAPPQVNNFTLRGPQQVVTLKRGETKVVTVTIDRVAGWRGNVTVALVTPEDADELDGLTVDHDAVKAGRTATATFRVTAQEDAPFREQVLHFSATTDVGEEVSLDVRVNVVRGR